MKLVSLKSFLYTILILSVFSCQKTTSNSDDSDNDDLALNDKEYFAVPGLNVMVFDDFYPEGHQGGVSIIQHGVRVAANGDVRLEPTPGQWSPVPTVEERTVDSLNQEISARLTYPDSTKNRKGFNPIIYPDLHFSYRVRVKPEGRSFRIFVDLEEQLPEEWIGKVGFNLELFPGDLFGKSYYMDDEFGIFPRQANGPMYKKGDEYEITPLAEGEKLVIVPENEYQTITFRNEGKGNLQLIDGRGKHSNGWFVVRSLIPSGATDNAIEWLVKANIVSDWMYKPVVHISQVGYHSNQDKIAVIELDDRDDEIKTVSLQKVTEDGGVENVLSTKPQEWGNFLRYNYLQFNFSEVRDPGMYQIIYGDYKTNVFEISNTIFDRHVWQPTLEYFLPVQMCHMRINDRYKVWHGLCHMDDALMAPTDTNHFDGYKQGPSTLTKYRSMDPVPGLNAGGWHDAGDYDLRVESQSGTVYMLSLIYENFRVDYDETLIDQENRIVEIHQPDNKPDVMQQIEHGLLTVLGGYENLGRLYRGIICPTLRQYTLLGDASTMTDNLTYDPGLGQNEVRGQRSGIADDRWVFTEENPRRALDVAGELAAASRVLKGYNDQLSEKSLMVAEELWENYRAAGSKDKIKTAVELLLTTGNSEYKEFLSEQAELIAENINDLGWIIGRIVPEMDQSFKTTITNAVQGYKEEVDALANETPFGVPYRPHIWGAGWGIQRFGVEQYFLHTGYPEIFDNKYMLSAMNFVLGCHPGINTASFASGVGANSLEVAYGVNRAEWSYIPGGVGSGTALIRPDFPEMKTWPFFWQQTEYVMGGGATNYMFLVLAANDLLN